MASQNHLRGFKELRTLSRSNLREVTTEKLAEISLKALESGNDTAEVFKFWTDEILNAYSLADFEANILNNIFCTFAEFTIQAVPNPAFNCITETKFDFITFNLGKWQSVLSKVDFNLQSVAIVLTITKCALRVLASYYTFLKNSKGATAPSAPFYINGLRAILNDSQQLQMSILSVILDNPTYFLCRNFTDIPEIAKVMECLIAVGKIVPGLDVRLTAEIWKTISKISSENSKFIIATEKVTMFLSKEGPIKFLCVEIRKNLQDIYQSHMKPGIVKRILKLSSFYLKLLIKFASDFSHQFFVDNNEVIITLMTVLSPPENLKNTPVNILINQHLTIGFMNLVSLIYKNCHFVESLCKINVDSDVQFEAFFCLSSEVLKLLISGETAAINLYLTNNFIEKIFEAVTKYPITLLQRVNYEIFVTLLSALMLSICNESLFVSRLENCLIRGVLQNDLLLATICIDIWHTLLRFVDVECRYKYFMFWYNRCMEFPILSNEPRAIYANNLLRNSFKILPKRIQNKFCNFILNETDRTKPLILFGFEKFLLEAYNPLTEMSQVRSTCRSFSSNISAKDYFTMLANLLIVGASTPSPEFGTYEQVLLLFVKLLKITIIGKQTTLHISCMIFITSHLNNYSKTQLKSLVRLLVQYWVHFKNTTFKLCIVIFLSEMRRIEQSELLQSLVTLVQTDSQILVRSTARALLDQQSDSPIQVWNNSEIKEFLSEQCIIKFSPRCYKNMSNQEGNPVKRLKMEVRRDDLKNILCDVNKFANTHKDVEFSTSDLAVMNEIKNIFLRLCNK